MSTLGESSLGIVEYASVTRSLSEVNPKRGRYLKFSDEDRFEIGKYAALHGPKSTIIKFKKEHPHLKESTVRAFREKYYSSLKAKKVGTAITKKLPSLKRGRPLLPGTIDEKVKNFLFALRQKGGVVNTVVAIATAKALIERSKDEHLKLIDLESCYWAESLFRRMGFVKRASTTSRPEIPYGSRKEAELIFHHDIAYKVEKFQIPELLIININQTPSKFAPASSRTMAKKNSKHVSIASSSYKKAITATFGITFSNAFLPMQLIYAGKTAAGFPKVKFPYTFSLSANPKHFSNTKESLKLIEDIIIPYIESERKKRGAPNQHALIIMDVFTGQMTGPVLEKLRDNKILLVRVPANMTNIFQPLDLTVNGSFKAPMKKKLTKWYSKQIANELEKGTPLDDIEVKLKLSVLKPLHAGWLIDAYNHLTSEAGRKIIANGWQSAGITSAISKGVQGLPTLDPFDTIDPLVNHADESDNHLPNMNSEEIDFFINLRGEEEDSSDDEWEMEDTGVEIRNAFDMFLDDESDE